MLENARALAGRLITELAYPDDLSCMAIEAGCLELLASATRASGVRGHARPAWLTRVGEYLSAEFRQAPALGQVARLAGVHPSHLVREFKRAFGETPASRIRRLRIEWTAPAPADRTNRSPRSLPPLASPIRAISRGNSAGISV